MDILTILLGLGLAIYGAQDLLASTEGAVATNLVGVYQALGGGWQIRAGQTADQLIPKATKDEMLERTKYWDGVLD